MDRYHFLLLSSVLFLSAGQQDGCSICGDGKGVSAPDVVFVFPGQPSVPCGLLELAGETGQIPLEQCVFLPPIIPMCQCVPLSDLETIVPSNPPTPAPTPGPTILIEPSPAPTPGPTSEPTPVPTPEKSVSSPIPSICRSIPSNGCSVCGENKYASNVDEIFEFPGQPSVPCNILEGAGEAGSIPLDSCEFLPNVISTTCGCKQCPDTNSNTNTQPPTLGPTIGPTATPSRPPTSPPTLLPTSSPTKVPTPMPVPVVPTPAPLVVFTPAPTEMLNGDGGSDGKKTKKKSKGKKVDKSSKKSKKKEKAG